MKTKRPMSLGRLKEQITLQSMILPAMIVLLIFAYIPMYGIIIAFKDFNYRDGIWGSDWVGLKHFISLLKDPNLWNVLRNTMIINVLGTLICFPAPIMLALIINEPIIMVVLMDMTLSMGRQLPSRSVRRSVWPIRQRTMQNTSPAFRIVFAIICGSRNTCS